MKQKRTFLSLLKLRLICLLSILFASSFGSDQAFAQNLVSSKLFLHTDRTEYFNGDTLWFKAYGWCGAQDAPDTINRVVYLNVINSEGKLIKEKSCYMKNGSTLGEWSIDEKLPSGYYLLQAHTLNTLKTKQQPFTRTVKVTNPNDSLSFFCYPKIQSSPQRDSIQLLLGYRELEQNGAIDKFKQRSVNYLFSIGNKLLAKGTRLLHNNHAFRLDSRLPNTNELATNDTLAILTLSIPNTKIEKQFAVPIRYNVDVQWLPESGNLLAGIRNKVAFKTLNDRGESEDIEGVIVSSEGDTISRIATIKDGMGFFYFTPKHNEEYKAILTNKMFSWIDKLPKAEREGTIIQLKSQDEHCIELSLKASASFMPKSYRLIFHRDSVIYSNFAVKIDNRLTAMSIPKDVLPSGVVVCSLMDSEYNNLAERLIFVEKNLVNITCKTDSSKYGSRQLVKLKLKATNSEGEPLLTHMSLSVVDKNLVSSSYANRNISSYKLLSSELRGNIENADGYFTNGSFDTAGLDLVMLTHGFRKVEVSCLPDSVDRYLALCNDTCYTFSGHVGAESKKRYQRIGYSHLKLSTMSFLETEVRVIESEIDSLGRFAFTHPLHHDFARMVIQAQRPNRKKTGRRFWGTVKLDLAPDVWDFHLRPDVPSVYTKAERKEVNRLQAYKRNKLSQIGGDVAWKLDLDEVTVKAKNKKWYDDFGGQAINTAALDTLDPTGKKYEDLVDLLEREFGAKVKRRGPIKIPLYPCIAFEYSEFTPILIINGYKPGPAGALINVNEIKKLMIVPSTSRLIPFYRSDGAANAGMLQTMVAIETYKKGYRGDPEGVLTQIHQGLNTPKQFYSPKYDKNSSTEFDNRTTLYWNPLVITDEKGEAEVEFYTSDSATELDVLVNGVQFLTGNTGSGTCKIAVVKN